MIPEVPLLDSLALQTLTALSNFTADQLSCTMWGFAHMGYIPGTPLLDATSDLVLRWATGCVKTSRGCYLWSTFAGVVYVGYRHAAAGRYDRIGAQVGDWVCVNFKGL